MTDELSFVIYGITKGDNLFTGKGAVDSNFNHVDEKIEHRPIKPIFFKRNVIREDYDNIITCTSRRSFRKVQKFLREHKEPHREIIGERTVDFHITENQWKEIQDLKIANIKKL